MNKLMVVASAIAIGSASSVLAAENGLVAHFTFDDATQFGYDSVQKKVIGEISSANYHEPALVSAPVSCDAPFVRGMQFKDTEWYQTSCMSVPGTSFGFSQGIPCGGRDVTYSLWIKPATKWQTNNALGLGSICFLLRHAPLGREWWKDNAHAHIYIAKGANDYPKIAFNVGEQLAADSSAIYQLPGPFDGNWHFVVATYSQGVLTLYYDGAKVATKTDCYMGVPDNSPLTLGEVVPADNWNAYSQRRYLGGLDDVKVYSRTLTDDEVLAAYQAGATAYDTDVLEWDGAAAGGAVEDVGNWSTKSNRRTAEEIYAAGAVFDATALEEGGTLTHDADATLKLKGVVCSNGQDEVTLQVKTGALALDWPSTQRGLVAHLTFDDFANVGFDSGRSHKLQGELGATDGAQTSEFSAIEGVSGPALHFTKGTWYKNYYLRIPDASVVKENGIPTGGETASFSLWIQPFRGNGGEYYGVGCGAGPVNVLRRGKNAGDGTQMVLWIMNTNPAAATPPYLVWSIANWQFGGTNSVKADVPDIFDGNWHHVACSYENRCLKLYYDGELVAELAQTATSLNVKNKEEIVLGSPTSGYNSTSQNRYAGGMDELKVFNVALTAEEVKAEYDKRSQTLDGFPGTVPSPVKVQLDAGTTATVCGYNNEYASLVGSGSASISPVSSLKLDGTYALSGALTGGGSVTAANLVLGGDTSAYTGDFTVGENATITAAALNGLTAVSTFGGKVVLPAKATGALPADIEFGKAALVKAGTLVPPADFSQWTATIGGEAPMGRVKFVVDGNTLFCRYSGGTTVIIR